jgi:hypothetical protein
MRHTHYGSNTPRTHANGMTLVTGGPRRARRGSSHGLSLAAISGLLVGLTACGVSTVSVPPVALQVVQHTAQLTIGNNQTIKKTVSCGANEVLLSGGFDTSSQVPLGGDQGVYVLDSYPSDATGNPATSQGQIETSWTVTATAYVPQPVSVPITVNCLQGSNAQSAVWFQGFALQSSSPVSATRGCTDPVFGTLTGGGFRLVAPYSSMMASYPTQPNGVYHKAWTVEILHGPKVSAPPATGTAFAVCLTQLHDQPLAQQQLITPASAVDWELQQVSVGCSAPNELLVGGGYQHSEYLGVDGDSLVAPQLTAWRVAAWVGKLTTPQQPITAWAICVTTTPGLVPTPTSTPQPTPTSTPQPTATSIPAPTPTSTPGPQAGVCNAADFPTHTSGGPSATFAYPPLTYYYDIGPAAGNHYYVLCSSGTPTSIRAFLLQSIPAGGWTVTQTTATTIAAQKQTTPPSGYCYSVNITLGNHAGYPGEWDADFHPPILSC